MIRIQIFKQLVSGKFFWDANYKGTYLLKYILARLLWMTLFLKKWYKSCIDFDEENCYLENYVNRGYWFANFNLLYFLFHFDSATVIISWKRYKRLWSSNTWFAMHDAAIICHRISITCKTMIHGIRALAVLCC